MQWLPRLPAKSLLLAATILVSGCAGVLDEDGALTIVPYRIGTSGYIIVETKLNDQGPFRFAFDTGASISVVFDRTRERIGLEPVPGESLVIQGMVGSGSFPIAEIEKLQIRGETWQNARLASMPGDTPAGSDIDGVLGIDFFSRYAVGFSVRERVLRLYPPELVSERAYRGWATVPLRRLEIGQKGAIAYVVDIEIDAKKFPALFDLGAQTNVMNWRAARSIGVRTLKPKKDRVVSGAVESALVAAELEVKELRTGNLRWRHKTFLIADFPVFDVLGLDQRPMAIVGADLFNRRDFVIDFRRSRLLVRQGD